MPRFDLPRRGLLGASAALSLGAWATAAARPASAQAAPADGPDLAAIPAPDAREGRFVEVNGAQLFVEISGSGAPLLLLHGYPLSGALFARVRDDLATRYRVITIDYRGYGKSRFTVTPHSIEVYADDALAVMTSLGLGRAIVGGMSMGGPVALEMYRRAPARFRGLVLIDTIAAAANLAEAGLWRGISDFAQAFGRNAILRFMIKDLLTGATRVNQRGVTDYMVNIMRQATHEAAVGGALALAERPDFTSLLPRIAVPTLVLVGLEDTVYPVEISTALAAGIAGATLEVIPGASHGAIFEAPVRSAEAILRWAAREV